MLSIPSRLEPRQSSIETSRLILSPIDARDSNDLWYSVDASRAELDPWLPWVPFNTDKEASFRYAEASALDWDNGRACRFAIRERKKKTFIGVVGLEAIAHLHQSCELGYWLRTDAYGQGFMTEAARAAVFWAFQALHAHRIRVAAATNNHSSLAVIARLGFRFEGTARQAERVNNRWLDHAVFALLATDS